MIPSYRGLFLFTAGLSLGLALALVKDDFGEPELPEILLRATATDAGGSLSIATGQITDEVEGLYLLDSLTGDLYCRVLLPSGIVGGFFKTNVLADLGLEKSKKPELLMVTGRIDFAGTKGMARPASSVVHVADVESGAFATYVVMWSPAKAAAMTAQTGGMTRLDQGKSRAIAVRE